MAKISDPTILDLHGMRHHFVRNDVIRFIESFWDTNTKLQIITGNSEKMKEEVTQVLSEYKLNWTSGLDGNWGVIQFTV